MRRTLTFLVILMASAVLAASGQQVFRAGVDLVHFGVVVTDKDGAPILGLKAENFELLEEGTLQTLQFFAGGEPSSAPPLHLGFMIDNSGSMVKDIGDVRTAAIKFLNRVENITDLTLVDFDTEVRVARFGPDDFPRLIERIRSRRPEGFTALYDALGVYLNGASQITGDKILVLYTDGGDTRSSMGMSELLDLLKISDVTVYSIGYLQNQGGRRAEQQQILTRVAGTTGGQAFFPTHTNELDKMYDKILREISGRYSLGYVSTDTKLDGKWRDVKIRIVGKPELKDVKIRTRAGYYAPYKPS